MKYNIFNLEYPLFTDSVIVLFVREIKYENTQKHLVFFTRNEIKLSCNSSSSTRKRKPSTLPTVTKHSVREREGGRAREMAEHTAGISNYVNTMKCECSVEYLKIKSFNTLTFVEKTNIIEKGRPKSNLKIDTVSKGKKIFTRHFRSQLYETIPWLCGCSHLNKLFCWPCFLFSNEKTTWNTTGYDDLHNIHKSEKRHGNSVAHIVAMKDLKLFGKNQRIEFSLSEQNRLTVQKHNEEVRKNRAILTHLIRVVCLLGKLGLAFRGHDESDTSTNRGNYVEFMKVLGHYDSDLKSLIENKGVFRGLSPQIQNDIIDSVSKYMELEIKREVSEAPFVAIILDEATDISMKAQISSVLRFVSENGQIQERFLHFKDISQDRSANALFLHATQVLAEFNCASKLVAQTYDGAAVMAGEHAGLQAKLREVCKDAIFVHCYAHRLNLVLSQSVSSIKPVKVFFGSLSGFGAFFSKSTKRTEALDCQVKKRFPSVAPTRWNYQSRLVETVHHHKVDIENLFISMIENDNEWDSETVSSARGFLTLLRDFDFNFFLKFFASIFPLSDNLFQVLQTKACDIVYCNKKIDDFKTHLKHLRMQFESFWSESLSEFPKTYSLKRNRIESMEGEDKKLTYKRLFLEIVDVLTVHIHERFSEVTKLKFLNLLNHKQFTNFKTGFPNEALNSLAENYGSWFEFPRLTSELTVVYSDSEFSKNVCEILKYITEAELRDVFPETHKLCKLILTIPATSASTERSFSALKRIKNYLRSTQGQERMSSLALLNIENGLLDKLMTRANFFDDVIDLFAAKSRRIELLYKK